MPSDVTQIKAHPVTLESDDVLDSWAASVLVAAGFLISFFFRGYFGNQTILLCTALVLPLVVTTIVAFSRFRRASEMDFPAVTIPVTLLWLWMGLSLVWCPAPGPALLAIFAVSGLPLGFWVYLLAPNREQMWRLLSAMLLASVVAIDLYAVVQSAIAGVRRPGSLFLDPNNLGALNVLAGMPVLAALAAETLFRKERRYWRVSALVLSLLLMMATLGLSGSRSALLAAVPGVLIVAWFSRKRAVQESRRVDRRIVVAAIGAIGLLAIVVATGAGVDFPLSHRFSDLVRDPLGTFQLRAKIWDASLRLLPDVSWYGSGMGVYWLLFPRVQDADDQSRGFNSHNDYLQLLIEGGVPAVLLLAAIIILSGMAMVRLWRSGQTPSAPAVTAAGLFAGLVAFWMQSTLQSNLYLLPMSFLVGLMLGRFHDFARVARAGYGSGSRFRIAGTPLFQGFVVISALCLPALFITSVAAYYYDRGMGAYERNDLRGAADALDTARRVAPVFDTVQIAQADLNVKRLFSSTAGNDRERAALIEKTGKILDEAQRMNPLRPDVYLLRGHMQLVDTRIDANKQAFAAMAEYTKALALDPRFSEARVAMSIVLARTGDNAGAHKLLEQGMAYAYVDTPELLQYLRLTAQVRKQSGDTEGSLQLAARANAIEQRIAGRR